MKKIICFALIVCFILVSGITASAYEVTSFEVAAKNAMLVSLDTGEVLYSKAENEKIYPASITKLMTAAVILDAYSDPSALDVTMTQTAYDKILGTGSVVLNAKVGEIINGKDALASILISSAGDIVYAYAEAVSGSIEAFVETMNKKAAELGLSNTHYENPIGLHHEENYTTVNDIRILAEHLIKNYPIVTEITSKSRYKMAATNMTAERLLVTTNYMIDPNTVYYYPYCTGLKTGFTDEAGRCLVSTASYNGYNYLCITMNCPTTSGKRTEFTTSKDLYKWAFTEFEYRSVLDVKTPATEIRVRLSSESDYVSLYPVKQVRSILPKEADNSSIVVEPHLVAESVDAPVKKGDVLGTADVIFAERVIGTVELIAGNDVESSALLVALDAVRKVVTSTVFKTIITVILVSVILFIAYVVHLNKKGKKKKRNVKYIPYDEEKEAKLRKKRAEKRAKANRPEYTSDDDDGGHNYFDI